MPVTRTSLAGAAVVAVAKRCSASRRDGAPASSTSRSTVGRQDDEATVGTAKRASRISTGLTEANSTIVIAESEDPARGREDGHVHVVQDEDLVPQHREPVEVLGPLLVGDGGDRGLQAGHVGLEADGDLVPEPALHPGRDGGQEPGRRPGRPEEQAHVAQLGGITGQDGVGHRLEADGQEGLGQGRHQGQHEGHRHQGGLVLVADLAQPPHGRQRGRQVGVLRRRLS